MPLGLDAACFSINLNGNGNGQSACIGASDTLFGMRESVRVYRSYGNVHRISN